MHHDGTIGKKICIGMWNVYYIYLHNMKFEDNRKKIPKTVEAINRIPNVYNHAFFSALNPNSHIPPHHGPTNKKLRLWMPLLDMKGTTLTAGNIPKQVEDAKVFVFDDSFLHEAYHAGKTTRITLIIDIWHPDLSKEEIKFFK